ncbi:unnamed protein product, partial [Symbiodinium pilosum]
PSRQRPPDEVASWLRSSRAVDRWFCTQGMTMRHDAKGSVSLLTLPSGYVQASRARHPLAAASAVSGIHVLRGHIILWLFDPRPQVEVAAAADLVARKLFGQKVALDLHAGAVATFPAVVFSSLEAQETSTALSFVLE